MSLTLWIALWLLVGIGAVGWSLYDYWDHGNPVTVRLLMYSAACVLVGPINIVVILFFLADMVVFKGHDKD